MGQLNNDKRGANMSKVIGSVVTFYPDWKTLETTIDSFFESNSSLKLVVWDNSSEDKISSKLKDSFGDKVTYHHSESNVGYGKGNNGSFQLAAGQSDYFCVINPDIKLAPGAIDSLCQFMDKNQQFGMATGSIVDQNGAVAPVHKLALSFFEYFFVFITKRFFKKDILTNLTQTYLTMGNEHCRLPIISGCFMFFRASHYKELNGFDERYFLYFEDWDISIRSFKNKKSIILPEIKIYHEWGRHSHKKAKILFIHIKSALTFYSKWGFTNRFANELNTQPKHFNSSSV